MSSKSNENSISLSKFNQRAMTEFFAEELIYDYLNDSLDEDRKRSLDAQIKEDVELQKRIEKTKSSLAAIQAYSEIQIEPQLIDILLPKQQRKEVNLKRWLILKKKRTDIFWVTQFLFVSFLAVGIVYTVPWKKVVSWDRLESSESTVLVEVSKKGNFFKKEDERISATIAEDEKEGGLVKHVEAAATPAAVKAPTPEVKAPTQTSPAVATVKAEVKKPKSEMKTEARADGGDGSGYVYRGALSVVGIAMNGPKLTDKIRELGGRKAGSVELGWNKSPKIMYYHFTMPSAKMEELQQYFGEFGKFKFSKEKHPRVMPNGISRFIIEVEER